MEGETEWYGSESVNKTTYWSQNGSVSHVIHEDFPTIFSVAGGLYLKALACGIDSVLETYRQKLVTVEQKVCMCMFTGGDSVQSNMLIIWQHLQ